MRPRSKLITQQITNHKHKRSIITIRLRVTAKQRHTRTSVQYHISPYFCSGPLFLSIFTSSVALTCMVVTQCTSSCCTIFMAFNFSCSSNSSVRFSLSEMRFYRVVPFSGIFLLLFADHRRQKKEIWLIDAQFAFDLLKFSSELIRYQEPTKSIGMNYCWPLKTRLFVSITVVMTAIVEFVVRSNLSCDQFLHMIW